jgi:hypothetical protein
LTFPKRKEINFSALKCGTPKEKKSLAKKYIILYYIIDISTIDASMNDASIVILSST